MSQTAMPPDIWATLFLLVQPNMVLLTLLTYLVSMYLSHLQNINLKLNFKEHEETVRRDA